MKLTTPTTAFIALASAGPNAPLTTPQRRDVPNVGEHTSTSTIYSPKITLMHPVRGNISSIAAWTYNALAYAIVTASNSTRDLTYLCANFNAISPRLYTAFPEPSGDIAAFARSTLCSSSTSNPPAPLPIWYNTLWYMKSYLAGIFTVQGYYGKPFVNEIENGQFYADMCWYLEGSLLRGLWAPNRDTDESGVDVESSWCAMSGYYGKGDYSMYTNASVPDNTAKEVDVLVSKLMARALKLVLAEKAQVEYICAHYMRFEAGAKGLGLVSEVVWEIVCGEGNRGVVEVGKAKGELLGAMTELFVLQLLEGGNYKGYHKYVCETYKADGLAKVGLDGAKVIKAACEAAKRELG
ncbi:hypothetical protein CC80DRAFT_538215 [Byssothecium circinans]|uniref:Uncharacterized protein n=1 Tax=Byssothecium circinans TaxID=147558 RepID=A0A6A5TIT8_9PLEO|nr:hypothetical protein CC80DRAFT_538215 [Byssothecium circinans]